MTNTAKGTRGVLVCNEAFTAFGKHYKPGHPVPQVDVDAWPHGTLSTRLERGFMTFEQEVEEEEVDEVLAANTIAATAAPFTTPAATPSAKPRKVPTTLPNDLTPTKEALVAYLTRTAPFVLKADGFDLRRPLDDLRVVAKAALSQGPPPSP